MWQIQWNIIIIIIIKSSQEMGTRTGFKDHAHVESSTFLRVFVRTSSTWTQSPQLIERCKFDPSHIIIPNNKEKIVSDKVIVLDMDSHELIERLSKKDDALRKETGFSGQFDFIYLDYCGTWNSKSGKRRQRDVQRLMQYGLVSENCLLAVTASQRGSCEIYVGQTLDEMVLYLSGT